MEQKLPYITPELPGIGGTLKEQPQHFVVQEIPLYEPSGQGEHLYICLEREGWNTRDLQKELASLFGLKDGEVGYAGLKDKQALVTQTFSLQQRSLSEEEAGAQVEDSLPVKVLWAKRHGNKLKRGHLLGNNFRILVSGVGGEALEPAQAAAQALAERGLPNFFGEQRFGAQGDNAEQGRRALTGRGPRQKWLRQLLLSAYQSHLFNLWLTLRMERGWFARLLPGDMAKKTDTGGMFTVEDIEAESPRFDRGEITYTGPIYGSKMRPAGAEAGELEAEVLAQEDVTGEMLKKARLKGSRRLARLMLDDLKIEPHEQGLWFSFALPKGSYATTVLREFMKNQD